MKKEGVKVITDGSDPLDAAAQMLDVPKESLEHLREFDTPEKIERELDRLKKERGVS